VAASSSSSGGSDSMSIIQNSTISQLWLQVATAVVAASASCRELDSICHSEFEK